MATRSRYLTALAVGANAAALALVVACEGDQGPSPPGDCGSITSLTPSKGTLIVAGRWPIQNTQLILVLDAGLPDAFVATPNLNSEDGNGVDHALFSGLPSGTFTVRFTLSGCTDKQGNSPGLMTAPPGDVTIP